MDSISPTFATQHTRSKQPTSPARTAARPFADLCFLTGDAADLVVSPRENRRSFGVCIQTHGAGFIDHGGGSTAMTGNEVFVVAPLTQITWRPVDFDSRCIIALGGSAFSLSFQPHMQNAITLDPLHPVALLLKDCLTPLVDFVPTVDPRVTHMLTEVVADLVDTAFDQANRDPSTRQFLAKLSSLEKHLTDPQFDVPALAHRCGLKLRALQRRFNSFDTTPRKWILERRLERIRKMLDDASLANLTIRQIARQNGLPNFSHFIRSFNDAFGVSPGRYRR